MLVILAAAALLVAVIYVARYDQNYDTGKKGYDIKCEQNSPPSSATASLACTIHSEKEADQGKPEPPWWHKLLAWPEGITAWLIMLTLGAIIWQAWETRKAAGAAADSANAAYGSVAFAEAQWELTREKERARLDVKYGEHLLIQCDGNDLRHLAGTIRLRNIGANRAFIRRTYGKFMVKDVEAAFEEWEDDYAPLTLPDRFLDPDEPSIVVFVYLVPDERDIKAFAENLEKSRKSLHLFGFIEYETLGLHWRKDFGYDWNLVINSPLNEAGLGGISPLNYSATQTPIERISYGYWLSNQDWDKPEYPIGKDQPQNTN